MFCDLFFKGHLKLWNCILPPDMIVESVGWGIEFPFDRCVAAPKNPGRSHDVLFFCNSICQKRLPWRLAATNSVTYVLHFWIKRLLPNMYTLQAMDVPLFQTTTPLPHCFPHGKHLWCLYLQGFCCSCCRHHNRLRQYLFMQQNQLIVSIHLFSTQWSQKSIEQHSAARRQ